MKRVGKVFFLVLGVVGSTLVYSQNLSQHNWYFGNTNAGIRFNRVDNKPTFVTNKPFPFGTGGSAVATDPATGNLLFYTDGNTIYNQTFTPMSNGGLTGTNAAANQATAVCAVPGKTDKYFVFTNTANFSTGTPGTITYTVVDMAQFGTSVFPSPPFGDVPAGQKNLALTPVPLTNRSEAMIIVPDANGIDFWLITQAVNSKTFDATHITASSYPPGPAASFLTTTSAPVALYATTSGNLSYYAKTKKIAASPQDANTDALIVTFDDATGGFTFDSYILNSGVASTAGNPAIYDIEWDRNGQYLYISRTGEAGITADLLQYDYTNPAITLTSLLSTPVAKSFGLQTGPDSAMYYLYQTAGGQFLVDTFTKTDTIASFVKRNTTPLSPGDFKATQFPSFLPRAKPTINADFTFTGTCQNNATAFYPTITPNADSVHWDFGDGTDTTTWSPVYTFAQAQTFSVSLKAYYQGDSVTTTHSVTINPFALKLQLVQDTTACHCQLPVYGTPTCTQFTVKVSVSGGTATSYTWSNGDTGPTLTPFKAGYYYVTVTDGSGCFAYAGVNVKEYGKQDQRTNIWYFGNHAGIDFNQSPPVALSNSAMTAPEGCAIMCDRNGQAMFYTDGNQVYDKTDAAMPSGVPIGGDPFSSQSALIFPVPGDETLYYIFTTQAINGTSANEVRYSLFDLKQNSGLGLVTLKNQTLFSKSTERITANTNWVIFHEYGNNTFRAYRIGAGGIGGPVYTSIGSDHSFQFEQNGEGYMKLGGNNTLAVPISTPGVGNFIELFHFNDSTGEFSNFQRIDLNEPAGQIYGLEFSPGGKKLYATVTGAPTPSKLFEYWFDYLGVPHLSQPGVSQPAQLGAIQTGPDGQVYVAANDPTNSASLGTIQVNEDTLGVSGFTLKGFALAAATTSTLGLPNFAQQVSNGLMGPGFTWTGICLGDSTRFAGTARDAIDSFLWGFGPGEGSATVAAPAHYYNSAGTFSVSMKLHNRCARDTTITNPVTINAPPPLPTNTPAAALCNGPVVLDANTGNLPGLTYLWTDGQTTQTVTISNPAFISVTNTDANGCHSTQQSIVADTRPVLDFGPDQTVCQTSTGTQLDAQNPGANYVWTVPGGVIASTGQKQAVDLFSPATLLTPQVYSVSVTDPSTGCTITDQVTFTVKSSPTFTSSKTDPAGGCGTPTGTITLNLTGPDNVLYQYFINGPSTILPGFDKPNGFTTGAIPGLVAGVYTAIVVDEVSQCTTSKAITLNDASVSLTIDPILPTCSTVVITGTANGVNLSTPNYDVSVVDGTGLIVDPAKPNTNPFQTTALPPGTYIVTAKNTGTGCFASANATITALNPNIPFTLSNNLCSSPQTITASLVGPTYTWSGVVVSTGQGTNSITTSLPNGHTTVTVVASGQAGFCDTQQTMDIDYSTPVIPSFVQSNPCADQVTLTASPNNPGFIYRWYLKDPGTGTLNFVAAGQQTAVTVGGNYVVETTDPVTGCKNSNSPAVAVTVSGAISVTMSVGLTCDDGKTFTLTASTTTPGVTYAWFLNNNVIAGADAATLDQTAEGIYKVTVTKNACPASAQVQVTRFPIPEGELPPNWIICNDPENLDPTTSKVELIPGDFTTYNWFKNELTLGVTDPTYIADSEGLYRVDLTNSFGCSGSDQTKIENNCEPVVNAPNAFRPASGETLNNQFMVFSHFIVHDSFEIYVYNRWGELVYHSDKYDFKWNGSFNGSGQPMPGGMYAYVIKYVSSYEPDKGVQEKHGGVVLLK